jgi:hypothetical protein
VVRGGAFRHREEIVSVGDVLEIVPQEQRVILESIAEPEPLGRPRWRLRRA